jgi:hypothetical protein
MSNPYMRCVDVMPHQMKGIGDLHIFAIVYVKDKLFKVFNLSVDCLVDCKSIER